VQLARLGEKGIFYLSIVCDPTTGGVTASYASVGDIILAEPNALIGFAGPRVIEQTIKQELPKGFQRAEFLLDHGMVDKIVPRREMRETVGRLQRLGQPTDKLGAAAFERPALLLERGPTRPERIVGVEECGARKRASSILVAGTNGKGSVAAMVASAQSSGRRTGLCTRLTCSTSERGCASTAG
jgi:hypothetical protein